MKGNMIILEPRATEKTYREQTKRTYVFPVKKTMSKQEIAKEVEKEFSVTVTDVRVLIRKGKKTKFSKGRHAYPGTTFRRDHKYAYVTLKDGDSIKVFGDESAENAPVEAGTVEKIEEEAKKSEKSAKAEEKSADSDKKEEK